MVAGSVVGHVLDPLPHLTGIVTLEAVFDPPPLGILGLPDPSLQVSSSSTIQRPIARPEGCVPFPEQVQHLFSHPGLCVGIDPDVFVHSDSVCAVLDVSQDCCCVLLQVLMFKNIPVC